MVQAKRIDPRVVRTRQLLLDSFNELKAGQSSIQSISVLDITERAGVNRATFYAHFRDKYELLDVHIRERFKTLLKNKLPEKPKLNKDTLYTLIVATITVLEQHNQRSKRINMQYEPLFRSTIQQELQDTLTIMLANSLIDLQNKDNPYLSAFLSWAIFGSANEWTLTKLGSKETATEDIFSLICRQLEGKLADIKSQSLNRF